MPDQPMTLRGLILAKYQSITKFAKAADWSYAKAYRIATGHQDPTISEARRIGELLGVTDPATIVSLFSLA